MSVSVFDLCRFLQLKLTLAPFKDLHHHPGHLSLEVTDSTTIHGLCQVIKVHLEGSASAVAVFKDHTCTKASFLPPTSCLYHCGAVGGPRTHPVELEIFYDYKPVMNDCPLLMDESHLAYVPGIMRRSYGPDTTRKGKTTFADSTFKSRNTFIDSVGKSKSTMSS